MVEKEIIEERIKVLVAEEAKMVEQIQQTAQLVARQNTALLIIRGGMSELKRLMGEKIEVKEEEKKGTGIVPELIKKAKDIIRKEEVNPDG